MSKHDDLPPPPPGIAYMTTDEYLNRKRPDAPQDEGLIARLREAADFTGNRAAEKLFKEAADALEENIKLLAEGIRRGLIQNQAARSETGKWVEVDGYEGVLKHCASRGAVKVEMDRGAFENTFGGIYCYKDGKFYAYKLPPCERRDG